MAAPLLCQKRFLSILPGKHILRGVADLCMRFFAHLSGINFVDADMHSKTLSFVENDDLAWQKMHCPRPMMLISPQVTDLAGSLHKDQAALNLFSAELNNVLAPCSFEAAWLVRGETAHPHRDPTGHSWVSEHTLISSDTMTVRVLDSV